MALYSSDSRYSVSTAGTTAQRSTPASYSYRLYTVRQGDTLESIAARLLGSTSRYWELADLNPQVKFPLDLSAGDVIRIPV